MPRIDIFDLDYTIFDAREFKRTCLAPFFGMSEQEFSDYYKNNFKEKGINYNAETQMRDMGWSNEKIAAKIKEFEELMEKEVSKYLYPEAEKILKRFKGNRDEIILASFGDKEFQSQKISKLKIGGVDTIDFFDEVIISDGKKCELEELKRLKGRNILLVNDNLKEAKELKDVLGENCEIFLVDGPYARNHECDIAPRSLNDLKEKFFPGNEAGKELKIK